LFPTTLTTRGWPAIPGPGTSRNLLQSMELLLSESLATKIIQVVAYVILSTNPCFEARYSDSILVPVFICVIIN
jgi:hypothetical protein